MPLPGLRAKGLVKRRSVTPPPIWFPVLKSPVPVHSGLETDWLATSEPTKQEPSFPHLVQK
jgi:hypothetical protein